MHQHSRREVLIGLASLPISALAAQIPTPPVISTDPASNSSIQLPVPRDNSLPSLFLVGDSTVRNGKGDGANNQLGWGEPLVSLFDSSRINVVNRAIGGRSSRTYITEGHWADTLQLIKPGDTMLVQFGHNDSGAPDEPTRARASLPGAGGETQEIENPILKRQELVHTFGWYMGQYVTDALARGATPIVCSLIPRKTWKDGKIVRSDSSYQGWARQVAANDNVGFVDLNHIIADLYDAMGEQAVEPLFGDPHTHTSAAGAVLNAKAVVAGLKALPANSVTQYLSLAGQAVLAFKENSTT